MNLDFSLDPLFSWYVVLLCLSGIAMIVLGTIKAGDLSIGWRILNVLAGVGFVGYGIYLGFIFQGGSYRLFFQAFILPAAMIFHFFRALLARREAESVEQQQQPEPTGPTQPS